MLINMCNDYVNLIICVMFIDKNIFYCLADKKICMMLLPNIYTKHTMFVFVVLFSYKSMEIIVLTSKPNAKHRKCAEHLIVVDFFLGSKTKTIGLQLFS